MTRKELFKDIPNSEYLLYKLYDDKYFVGLNEFISRFSLMGDKKLLNDEEKLINKTLDYISILVKNKKLKLKIVEHRKITDEPKSLNTEKIMKYVTISEKEYGENEIDDAVQKIKKTWLGLSGTDRVWFENWGVMITLVENKWPL